jgi:Cro/C1-type helix-turn-helix DNA-binding protein
MRTWILPACLQSRFTIPPCFRAACLDRTSRGPLMISCQLSARLGAHPLSQARFARLVGLHRDTVRTLYADNWTSIRREVLERISTTLQVPVGKLLIRRTHRTSPI